jgi:hypothetical protein
MRKEAFIALVTALLFGVAAHATDAKSPLPAPTGPYGSVTDGPGQVSGAASGGTVGTVDSGGDFRSESPRF